MKFVNNMATKKKGSKQTPKRQTQRSTPKNEGSRQFHSVIWFAVAIFLLCVVFIKGQNIWTFIHNFIFGIFGAEFYINSQTQNPVIAEMGTDYLRMCCVFSFGMSMFAVYEKLLQATGHSVCSTIAQISGAVTNIILDPIFIFAFHMGVKGAALATILSQAISCVWVLLFLCGKKTYLKLKKQNLPIDGKLVFPCIALGTATFIMQSSESVISVCFNSSLLKYGGDIAVGAMTILTSVMQFAMLPMQGIAQGAQPILSSNFGAKNGERVKKTYRLLLVSCLTYSFIIWGAIMLVPQMFAGIFTPDGALIDFTATALRVYCGVLCIFGIQIACQMTFVSTGNAPCSIIVAIVRKFVLLLPLIYLMPGLMPDKTMGIYMAEPVADIIAVSFTAVLFAVQFRKSMKQ